MNDIKAPKKLIEVALPLEDINAASIREKSIRHGHPSTLHIWWARRPLASARAVLFAQLINDPGYERELGRGVNKEKAEAERKRLFAIMKKLVIWENTTDELVMSEARAEVMKSWRETCLLNKNHPDAKELFNPEKLPAFHDPFAGGGAIPLEAQRLGLEAGASDLNPVAVLINKAMIEIPPRFAGRLPVNPESQKQQRMGTEWHGAMGLADDIRYYGNLIRFEAEKRIGNLYPKVNITNEMAQDRPDLKEYVGEQLTVIAWIWARTVRSPNPAYKDVYVPLVRSFRLSTKNGRGAWIEPVVNPEEKNYYFKVHVTGEPKIEGTVSRQGSSCIMSGAPIDFKYIRAEGRANRMGLRLMAIVAEGVRGRVYLPPSSTQESTALSASPKWKPDVPLSGKAAVNVPLYGLTTVGDLFTPRQLTSLTTFSDLITEIREQVLRDAIMAGLPDDPQRLECGGSGASAYADAISVYLSFGISRLSNRLATICMWNQTGEKIEQVFARQAIPMTWDFAEANVFSKSTGGWEGSLGWIPKVLELFPVTTKGTVTQENALYQKNLFEKIVSTDPPYYDNICYADLSDFFYVWLRRSLKQIYPSLFATMAVPKDEELIAAPYCHGSKEKADLFFLNGMTEAMRRLAEQTHPAFPVTIYYAFKQSETKGGDTSSTGWEAFLEAVLKAGFTVTGTWPMRTERDQGLKTGSNVLASSIILVCRRRDPDSPTASRKDFLRDLKLIIPDALDEMTTGAIAPVDLAQAAIGPGIGAFSQYSAILEADGTRMSMHDALVLINRELDGYFSGASGDLDADSRFCLGWFEQVGWKEGKFGEADVLARARGTTVDGVREAGIVEAGGGKVRLLKWNEYEPDWSPETDSRKSVWEALHHLVRTHQNNGDISAGALLAKMPDSSASIRQLAYRLYTLCERKGWAEDARPYNELITSWGAVEEVTPASIESKPQKKLDSFGD